MFGSEYSERMERRDWVRDGLLDHMLRRTSDGYMELIEIKTPMRQKSIFNYDPSHDCYHPSAPLSKVIGQVMHYLEELDQDRFRIWAKDQASTNKIREGYHRM